MQKHNYVNTKKLEKIQVYLRLPITTLGQHWRSSNIFIAALRTFPTQLIIANFWTGLCHLGIFTKLLHDAAFPEGK